MKPYLKNIKPCLFSLSFTLALFINPSFGQVTISLLHSNPYKFNIEDIFNVSIYNNTSQNEFDLEVLVTAKNNLVYKAFSKKNLIPSGSSRFEYNSFNSISETFPVNKLINNLSAYRQFTTGEYEVCYVLKSFQTSEILGENCQMVELVNMTPIYLNSPEPNSIVNNTSPLFLWLPPTPLPNGEITYQIKIVEMLQNQSPFEALNRNPSLFAMEQKNQINLTYPNNAFPLENHKSYAWQVIDPNNRKIDSEIWKFTIKIDSMELEERIVINENYIIPSEATTLSNLNIKNQLRVLIDEPGKIDELSFEVRDINQKRIETNDVKIVSSQGGNKFILDLKLLDKLKNRNYYQVIITTPNSRHPYVIFFRYFQD